MVKVAIYKGFGCNKIPKRFKGSISDFSIESRVKLAEELLKIKVYEGPLPLSEEIVNEEFKKGNDIIHVVTKGREEFVCLESKCDCYIIDVVEVDTSKPWRLSDYDGSEGIEYFDGVQVVNEKYNMCNW